jgi:NAD(P)-dependent dehydrogenase (short-subunit alcohol dehydrogenase family)
MGPVPGFSAYAASKIANGKMIEYFTSKNKDVRVVSMHPGVIRSDMSLNTGGKYGINFTFDECKLTV